jgi:hypothetical protein
MAIDKVLYFFGEVGVLLSRRPVYIDLVDQLMGYNTMTIGNKNHAIIEEASRKGHIRSKRLTRSSSL